MIKPLRTYHFFVWRILAVIIPVLFILAIVFRPTATSTGVPNQMDFTFRVEKTTNATAQLSVELTDALKVPSCLVYVSQGSNDVLLGKIDHQGSYKFEFPSHGNSNIRVKLFDAIHKKIIMEEQVSYSNE